jgi:hypothetical protein
MIDTEVAVVAVEGEEGFLVGGHRFFFKGG